MNYRAFLFVLTFTLACTQFATAYFVDEVDNDQPIPQSHMSPSSLDAATIQNRLRMLQQQFPMFEQYSSSTSAQRDALLGHMREVKTFIDQPLMHHTELFPDRNPMLFEASRDTCQQSATLLKDMVDEACSTLSYSEAFGAFMITLIGVFKR